jgi:hypothetical protein
MNIPLALMIAAVCFFILGGTLAWYVVAHPHAPAYGAILVALFIACPCLVAGAAVVFNTCGAEKLYDATVRSQAQQIEYLSTWHPIASAPKDGSPVLLIGTRNNMLMPHLEILVAEYRSGWWSGRDTVSHATHWLPLPGFPVDARDE